MLGSPALSAANGLEVGIRPAPYRLPATAQIGRVRLAVSNLERSVDFYTGVIGLSVLSGRTIAGEHVTQLGIKGTNEVLLELQALPGVRPIDARTRLGLYHTAFLLPGRSELASFVLHLKVRHIPFGSSDHLYSEAIYLTDPDGLAVEVYADRPRELWTVAGQELLTGVSPLHFENLPAVAQGSWAGAPVGTRMGHIHLYVGDLEEAKSFYHHALGLDIMTWSYPGALFTSAGGYHHHVGLNVWAAGSPQASEKDARLLFWELKLPNAEELHHVRGSLERSGYAAVLTSSGQLIIPDPWGINLLLIDESDV